MICHSKGADAPFLFYHTNLYYVHKPMRNITDEQIHTLIGRMEYLKGFMKQIAPQLDEADNEIIADLIWALKIDQDDLQSLKEEQPDPF